MSEKKYLSEEEIAEFVDKSIYDNFRIDGGTLARMKNSIEKLEAEFKDVKGLKDFVTSGVLVNPHLILAAEPDNMRLGMTLTALSGIKGFDGSITASSVDLRVQDVDRFIRLLPELLKAARLYRSFKKLKEMHKEKSQSRGRRY